MSKMENTFAWGRISGEEIQQDLSNYYTKAETNKLLDTKQIKLVNSNDILVNNNQLSINPSVFSDYLTITNANNTFAKLNYVNNTFKKHTKDNVNYIVLPKNSKVGVNSFDEYKQMFNGVIDFYNNPIDLDSTDNVSMDNNSYNGYSRSYVNYVDFYLPNSAQKLNYFDKNVNLNNYFTKTEITTNYYNKTETDKLINNVNKVILYPTNPSVEIINLPNGRKLLKFQMTTPSDNIKNDWWGNIPQEIKSLININNIEFFDYIIRDANNQWTRAGDFGVIVNTYQNRLYISAWNGASDYWRGKLIRLSIIVS